MMGGSEADENEAAGPRRWMAAAGRVVAEDGAVAAGTAGASAAVPQSTCVGPGGDGCDLFRHAHRLSVECAVRDEDLFLFLGAPAFPGMGGRRGVCGVLARGLAG